MSYESVKQKILNGLMNRPVGTQILPEKHQEFELELLEYVKQLESVSVSSFIGYAESSTIPIQPNDANVFYIAFLSTNASFTNFRDSNGNVISVTCGDNQSLFVILNWNKVYWSSKVTVIPLYSVLTEKIDLAIILAL